MGSEFQSVGPETAKHLWPYLVVQELAYLLTYLLTSASFSSFYSFFFLCGQYTCAVPPKVPDLSAL